MWLQPNTMRAPYSTIVSAGAIGARRMNVAIAPKHNYAIPYTADGEPSTLSIVVNGIRRSVRVVAVASPTIRSFSFGLAPSFLTAQTVINGPASNPMMWSAIGMTGFPSALTILSGFGYPLRSSSGRTLPMPRNCRCYVDRREGSHTHCRARHIRMRFLPSVEMTQFRSRI